MIKVGNRGNNKKTKGNESEEKIFKLSNKLPLDTMLGMALEVQQRSKDMIIERFELSTKLNSREYLVEINGEPYLITNLAINQLCGTYSIPKKFVNSLLSKSAKLSNVDDGEYVPLKNMANDLFNRQLEAEKELNTGRKFLIRAIDGNSKYIRAVLSDRFMPMDNYPLLEACKGVIRDHYVISSSFIDDEAMVARFYFKEQLIVKDRRFAIGIELRNSEVGTYSLQMRVIVSAADFGSFILTSTPVIRLRHTSNKSSMLDIAMELEDIAVNMREKIEDKVRLLFLDDNLNINSLNSFLVSIKDVLKKDEYEEISKINIKNGKLEFLKGVYSIVYDSDYNKLDTIEREVSKRFFEKFNI